MTEQNPQPNSTGDWLPPVPWAVLRARCFTAVQGRVLFVLWSRCNRAGDCYTGIVELGKDAGCDARTATAAVDWLAEHGVIGFERPSGKAPRYHLDTDTILAFVKEHPSAFPKEGDKRRTPHKIVGGTKLTTPYNNEGTTPHKIVVAPPTKLWDEEEPIEEDPLKKSPSSVLPVLPSVEPTEPARAPQSQSLSLSPELALPFSPEPDAEPEPEQPKRQQQNRMPDSRTGSTPRQSRRAAPQPEPAVSPEFVERMVAKFGAALGEEPVRFEIQRALAHDAARKYTRHDLYVEGWLRREAERKPAPRASPGGGPSPPARGSPVLVALTEDERQMAAYLGLDKGGAT